MIIYIKSGEDSFGGLFSVPKKDIRKAIDKLTKIIERERQEIIDFDVAEMMSKKFFRPKNRSEAKEKVWRHRMVGEYEERFANEMLGICDITAGENVQLGKKDATLISECLINNNLTFLNRA